MKINTMTVKKRVGQYSATAEANRVAVVKLEKAIQSLKLAKKESGAKFVILQTKNGEFVIKTASAKQVLSVMSPASVQMKSVHFKAKTFARSNDPSNYLIEESKETMAAILESSKDSYERNKNFYSSLALNMATR